MIGGMVAAESVFLPYGITASLTLAVPLAECITTLFASPEGFFTLHLFIKTQYKHENNEEEQTASESAGYYQVSEYIEEHHRVLRYQHLL